MGKWLERALASVPLVPLAPIAPENEANGTIGTSGTAVADDIEREERLAVYGEPEREAHNGGGQAGGNQPQTPAAQGGEGGYRDDRKSANNFQTRPADWMPEPSPGVRILRPAVELSAVEYDTNLDRLIAALPAGSAEAQRLAFAKRKGWVTACEGRRIYTRGRF